MRESSQCCPKLKISKNHPSEAASYPLWFMPHTGSLWAKAQFIIHVPCPARPPFSWALHISSIWALVIVYMSFPKLQVGRVATSHRQQYKVTEPRLEASAAVWVSAAPTPFLKFPKTHEHR